MRFLVRVPSPRTWLALLLGAALSLGVVQWERRVPPVAEADAQVVLVAPTLSSDNPLSSSVGQLIEVAAVVERSYTGRPADGQVTAGTLTLADQGLRDATSVRVRNAGNQWVDDFDRPVLEVQAVAATAAEARRRVAEAIIRLRSTLDRLQDDAGVQDPDRVRLQLVTDPVSVSETTGDPLRGALGAILLGLLTAATLGASLYRRRVLRRSAS